MQIVKEFCWLISVLALFALMAKSCEYEHLERMKQIELNK